MAALESWSSDRLGDAVTLLEAALLDEAVSPDELLAAAWDVPGLVLGDPSGDGLVVARREDDGPAGPLGRVVLVAVHPGARRLGLGTQLLAAVDDWGRDEGLAELRVGGPVGAGLWPGVDVRTMSAMLGLLESAGYVASGAAINVSVPATFRAAPPDGFEVRRVLEPDDEAAVGRLVEAELPSHRVAVARGIDHGSCLAAFADDQAVAVAVHSIDRDGWLGPMVTRRAERGRGLGAALLGAVATDLMVAGRRDVEVVDVDRVGLFLRAGGAVSRVFRIYRKRLT